MNFRKKLDKTLQFRGVIKDFLIYADKFGYKYEQFLKSSSMTMSNELNLKCSIKDILPKGGSKDRKFSVKDQDEKLNSNNVRGNIAMNPVPNQSR